MFDDWNVMSQQDRMCRAITVARRVDIERIDSNQDSGILREISSRSFREKRMIAARVFFSAPVLVPACMNQHRFVFDVNLSENLFTDLRLLRATHDNTIQIRDRIQIERREI